MNWDNYGNTCGTELKYNCSWDLDHIVPISYAKTEEEIYILNHWSNFQPLCSKINRDIKKAVLHPCTNLELKITKIK
jgi:5-methylcytosine-specific restriction endonuclease McrA